ncbi:MAG: tetratricopeptide repeat protein, partial [Flavitalea sp.]
MSIRKYIPALLLVSLTSCQLKDVLNPNVTDESFIGTTQSSQVWLNGMQRQLAQTLNQTVHFTEIVSDNYYNNSSLSNKVFDIPTILYNDLDVDNMQRAIGRLSEMAEYGINSIIPADAGTTADMKAEIYFIGGYANLIKGEINHSVVLTANGEVLPAAESFKKAIAYFKVALETQPTAAKKNNYTLALARAYYNLGDKTNAVALANSIRTNSPMLLLNAVFDGVNGVSNTMQTYTFSSSTNTYAPLPRLDFLDPKYFHVGNASTDQKPIAILKGEEAFLILAEAAIGNNDLAGARTILRSLITEVISKRPTAQVNGSIAQRKGNRSDYPLLATVKVKFDANSPERPDFIL